MEYLGYVIALLVGIAAGFLYVRWDDSKKEAARLAALPKKRPYVRRPKRPAPSTPNASTTAVTKPAPENAEALAAIQAELARRNETAPSGR